MRRRKKHRGPVLPAGEFNMPATRCPACNHKLEAATALIGSGRGPRPLDFSICICCGELLRYAADMSPVIPTDQELIDLPFEFRNDLLEKQELAKEFINEQKALGQWIPDAQEKPTR